MYDIYQTILETHQDYFQPALTCAQETSVCLPSTFMLRASIHTRSEDAPAPNPIHSFKAEVKDGKIHVTADPANTTKKIIAREPKVLSTGSASSGPGVVIVGGGSGTFHAINSLREVCEAVLV